MQICKIVKTGKKVKLLLTRKCVTCKQNKSVIVSDQTIQAEGLSNFFSSIGKAAKNVGKKILNNPGSALELAANIGNVAASKNRKFIEAIALEVVRFVHQREFL